MKKKKTKNFDDIWYTVVYQQNHDYCINFEVYKIEAEDLGGNPQWHKRGSVCYPDPVEILEESEPEITGEIKWDHCSNWDFVEARRGILHYCTKESAVNLGVILGRCYDIAAEELESWDD